MVVRTIKHTSKKLSKRQPCLRIKSKSQIIRGMAKKLGIKVIEIHLSKDNPLGDLKDLPRFKPIYFPVKLTKKDWIEWATKQKISPTVLSFVKKYGFKTISPRIWVQIGRIVI